MRYSVAVREMPAAAVATAEAEMGEEPVEQSAVMVFPAATSTVAATVVVTSVTERLAERWMGVRDEL